MAERRSAPRRGSRRTVRPTHEVIAEQDPVVYDDPGAMEEAAVNFGRCVRILREWAEAERSEEEGYL